MLAFAERRPARASATKTEHYCDTDSTVIVFRCGPSLRYDGWSRTPAEPGTSASHNIRQYTRLAVPDVIETRR